MQKKALVIGLGVSGKAALRFLIHQGYLAVGVDAKELKEDPTIQEIRNLGGVIYTEKDFPKAEQYSFAVLSPGIANSHPIAKAVALMGTPLIGEIELGFQYTHQKAVAITGTNGKTTVTQLVEHVLRETGRKAKAVGNVGFALTEYLCNPDPEEILVVELSSYQLETLRGPFFSAAALLNITPDHLDRYENFNAYAQAKANIQFCLKNGAQLYVPKKVATDFGHLFTVSFEDLPNTIEKKENIAEHDFCNLQAAFAICQSLGVSQQEFIQAAASFKKPAHRIQFVKKINGVSYFDDSKGTNIDAAVQAVLTMQGPVILIAGGVDKGSSYLAWKDVFQGRVKQIFALGEAAKKISSELSLFFNVKIVDSLENAVQEASRVAQEGDYVLLSPGCSSFDMFRDYAHRGREFQKFVGLLEERGASI